MAHIQHRAQRVASGPNVLAFSSSNTAGHTLWLSVLVEDDTSTISSVIDSANGAWTAIGSLTRCLSNPFSLQLYYKKNCAAGANTVTVTPSAGSTTICLNEESDLDLADPLDDASADQGVSDVPDSGALTTSGASAFLVGAVASNRLIAEGSGFTLLNHENFNLDSLTEYKAAGVAGTYHAVSSLASSGSWICCAAAFTIAGAGTDPPPTPPTSTVTHRNAITEPALPTMGAAGSVIIDPSFGSRIARITDANTLAEANHSFTTPSASHSHCISKNGTRFYVISNSGDKIPMTYTKSTMQAARIGSLTIGSVGADPQFSYLDDDRVYVAQQNGSNHPVIKYYDFGAASYTTVLDLDTVATLVGAEIYCGSVYSTKTTPEQLAVIFGGAGQDLHSLAAVFTVANTALCAVVDTVASTIRINGAAPVATNITLDFHLHHIQIDLGGAFAILETTSTDIGLGRAAKYVWYLATNTFAPITVLGAAHSCCGFGTWINMDGPTEGFPNNRPYPQIRALPSGIASPRALIRDPFLPSAVYLDGHLSFHNAVPAGLASIVMSNYRSQDGPNDSPVNTCPWKAWDDEIISIPTLGAGLTTTVKRWCHFRSNVRADGDADSVQYFYYTPRPNGSDDGEFCFLTSNWEKTLGTELGTGIARHDVFVVETAVGGVSSLPSHEVRDAGLSTAFASLPAGLRQHRHLRAGLEDVR